MKPKLLLAIPALFGFLAPALSSCAYDPTMSDDCSPQLLSCEDGQPSMLQGNDLWYKGGSKESQ